MSMSDYLSLKFTSLQELDLWYQNKDSLDIVDEFRISREKIENYSRIREIGGKTDMKVMLCHDYKGNYNPEEDESPFGYFPHSTGQHYFIQFPTLVDIFIYFSHNRVSVPPVSWINSLHKQGIPVLGTLLIEGAQHKLLDELIAKDPNDDLKFKYIAPLVELAVHYGFDGWLINIETVFSVNADAAQLLLFVEQLRSEIHRKVKNSQVVWYDSYITGKNRIFYQNGVNANNYDHFENTDSFFSNYWWTEAILRENILNVGLQGTKKKLYTGIDVWGRGSKVGHGGFETGVALNFLRFYSTNVSLFAPAWTYENFSKDEFIAKDQQFWVDEETNPGGSIATYIPFSTTPAYTKNKTFHFYTNFSQGEGSGFNILGLNVYDDRWVNGNLQFYAPTGLKPNYLEITKDDKFNGGSSLKVTLKKPKNDSNTTAVELFNFQNDIIARSLNVKVSFKSLVKLSNTAKLSLNIKYYIERRYRSISRVRDGVLEIPLKSSKDWKVEEITINLPRLQERQHFVISSAEIVWKPEGDIDESWIVVDDDEAPSKPFQLLLGDLLIESVELKRSINPIKKVISKKVIESTNEVYVKWSEQEEVLYWIIYVNSKFVNANTSPCWVLNKGDRLRVDCFTKSSTVVTGQDIFI